MFFSITQIAKGINIGQKDCARIRYMRAKVSWKGSISWYLKDNQTIPSQNCWKLKIKGIKANGINRISVDLLTEITPAVAKTVLAAKLDVAEKHISFFCKGRQFKLYYSKQKSIRKILMLVDFPEMFKLILDKGDQFHFSGCFKEVIWNI